MLSPAELNDVPLALVWLAWAAFALGGFICLANFELFIDWVRHRLRGNPEEAYRHVSALPIFGSLIVALMLRTLGSDPFVMTLGVVLILLDTGGIPWMIAGIVFQVILALRKGLGRLTAAPRCEQRTPSRREQG